MIKAGLFRCLDGRLTNRAENCRISPGGRMVAYRKPRSVKSHSVTIRTEDNGRLRLLIVEPRERRTDRAGVLWIHGGGYMVGMTAMVYFTRAMDLVEKGGAVVVAPAYSLSPFKPYPKALLQCHDALVYMRDHAAELGIRADRIMVGGESAGGGLTAALCMYAHDRGSVDIAFQMPLYPMMDCYDTGSSADNHEKVWNTRKNHFAWKLYLRGLKGSEVPDYASPSRRVDYSGLPPCYTFVGSLDPFLDETVSYVRALNDAGIDAKVDVFENWYHAYDVYNPRKEDSRRASDLLLEHFKEACGS